MKKTLKIIIPLVLMVILALGFSACSYYGDNSTSRGLANNRNTVDLRDGIIDGHNDLGARSSLTTNSTVNSLRVLPGVREVRVTDNGSTTYGTNFPTANRALPGRRTDQSRNNLTGTANKNIFDGTVGKNNYGGISRRYTSDNNSIDKY